LTASDVPAQYEARLRQLQIAAAQARSHSATAAAALAAGVLLLLILSVYAVRSKEVWWPVIAVPVVIASGRRYRLSRRSVYRASRLEQFYRRSVERINGNWAGSGASGEEFSDPAHVYSSDLDVFGEGSLFELLCTVRTANGKRGLADYLLNTPPIEEIVSRQEAVRELQARVDLQERIAVLGEFEFLESKWETFAEWLDSPPFPFDRRVRAAAFITSALFAIVFLGGMSGLIPWKAVGTWMAPLVGIHSAVGLFYRARVNQTAAWLRPVSVETQVLREGLRLMEETPFQSAKLRRIADRARNSSRSVRKLERLLSALNERNKEWFYAPSLLLLVGTQLCMAIEDWRIENGAALRIWLDAWAEFEALSALANYAYENPENTFPVFSSDGAAFEAAALGHPLLSGESCVPNDVRLNADCRFFIVSGSNMSGKSTLLRAIGLNAVLAFAGAPVRARALQLSRLSICASLSVVDSLLNGKSKFLAEMDRLRQSLEAAMKGTPVLFLIDEILSGTNSHDRRIASEAVVRTLIDRGAIGALSTHDLALSEIAEISELHGINMHTGSKDGGGPLDFDFTLKPGAANETNALAIAKMAGVPI
jgi:MutS domain V